MGKKAKKAIPANKARDVSDEREIDLTAFILRVLDHGKLIVFLCVLAGAAAVAFTVFLIPFKYRAVSKIYVVSSRNAAVNLADLQLSTYLASDYIEVFQTREVCEQVISELGLPYSPDALRKMITAENPSSTRILKISVLSPDPEEASAIANTVCEVARNYIAKVMQTDMPTVFSTAEPNYSPVSPNRIINGAVGALVCLIICLSTELILFLKDTTIKGAEDLAAASCIPVFGQVPKIKTKTAALSKKETGRQENAVPGETRTADASEGKTVKQPVVKSGFRSGYAFHEAINTVCSNITFSGCDVSCIEITSSREREGKSTLCCEIWKTMAHMGLKVALIDADLKQSSLGHMLGMKIQPGIGLAHYLSKASVKPEDILYETDIKNAFFIDAGRNVSNSMQLLSGEKLPELIEYLKERFDYILIDTPPVGAVVDAAVIAQWCDGALLVVRQNVTTKPEILHAKAQIEKTGCPILGAVLNQVDMNKKSSRYYNSSSYYSAYHSGYYSFKATPHK